MLPTHRTQAILVGVHLVCVYLKELSLVRRLLCRASRVRCETYFWESLLLPDKRRSIIVPIGLGLRALNRWGNPHFIFIIYELLSFVKLYMPCQKVSPTGCRFLDRKYNPRLHTNQFIFTTQVCLHRYLLLLCTIKLFLSFIDASTDRGLNLRTCSRPNAITNPIA